MEDKKKFQVNDQPKGQAFITIALIFAFVVAILAIGYFVVEYKLEQQGRGWATLQFQADYNACAGYKPEIDWECFEATVELPEGEWWFSNLEEQWYAGTTAE
jgi:hypothetical protein